MDDEEETYRLWKIRKTIMQVIYGSLYVPASLACYIANLRLCVNKYTSVVSFPANLTKHFLKVSLLNGIVII